MEQAEREKNRELFHKLLSLAGQEKYDDDYLQALIEFWQFLPENEVDGDIFYAKYALYHKNYTVAYEYGHKAYAKRKINLELWRVLRDASYALGKMEEALLYAGFADKIYKEPVQLDIPRDRLQRALDTFSLAMGRGNFAPVAVARMRLTDKGMEENYALFAGEFLPEEGGGKEEYRLFSAAYAEQEMINQKGRLLSYIKDIPEIACICGADFVFDLLKVADKGNTCHIPVGEDNVLVGLVGRTESQQVEFHNKHEETADFLGKWATSFFRLRENTEIKSNDGVLCTPPIVLRHDRKRCKVVLNILLDALSWKAVQDEDYTLVPHILKFFKKGIIFNHAYSVSEYTFPSVATIETSLYPYHSQIFNEKASHSLNREHKSLSERLHEQGYYCVNIMGDGTGVYTGIMRGFDRLIVNAYDCRVYQGVERTLHHLEAFRDTDQFIFLHTADTHPWAAHTYQLPITTQTAFELEERSIKKEKKKASVYLPNRPIYHHWNKQGIKDSDAALAKLFAYLEENYTDDEYLVTLYSDHGVAIYDAKNYILSRYQTGTAFMMRGRNVPQVGFVDELASVLDIYPSLAKCLGFPAENIDGNLPEVLGGKQRDYTVSMSMFPGIPHMLCIRNKEYECHVMFAEILDEDGREDLSEAKIRICHRDTDDEVHDEKLEAYFGEILHQVTRSVDNYGTQWPEMRAARPEWFDEREPDKKGLENLDVWGATGL